MHVQEIPAKGNPSYADTPDNGGDLQACKKVGWVRWLLDFGVVVGDGVDPLTTDDPEGEEADEPGKATYNVGAPNSF